MAGIQQFQHGEEETPTTSATTGTTARYDAETMQRVIETATRLQQAHRETVSADQIEEIGKEVGLDAVFVRRALDLVAAQSAEVSATPSTTQTSATPSAATLQPRSRVRARRKVEPLTGSDVLRACSPGLFYGLYAAMAVSSLGWRYEGGGPLFGFIQPLLLTLWLAWHARSLRRAAITGATLGFFGLIAAMLAGGFGRPEVALFFGALAYGIFLAALGTTTAAVSRWLRRIRFSAPAEETEQATAPNSTTATA